jgi:DNA mismatch endonuclease (patch repair protein)
MNAREVRRRTMQAVKSKDTGPEMLVRRQLYAKGYRYRLHRMDLPGCPDLVFRSRKKVIFVHGCFWHGHNCQRGARVPVHNRQYWTQKITKNRERDKMVRDSLHALGWKICVLWECELKDMSKIASSVQEFLDVPQNCES